MIEVIGLNGISAKILADSINSSGDRMTSLELNFPRFILAENNTHRMLSKNAASSRAIPVDAMLNQIEAAPAMPVHWGENNPGMQSKKELDETRKAAAQGTWLSAMQAAISYAKVMSAKTGINAHKQIVNRLTEPFAMTKQVLSGTNFANLLNLRDHSDAQPEFQELAKCIRLVMEQSIPQKLNPGEWHLPYVEIVGGKYFVGDYEVSLDVARKVSASCCAQVSYRKLDDSIEKALKIFDMLHLEDPNNRQKHSSPVEHQATPMDDYSKPFNPETWQPGITHVRRDGSLWSGNLRGWIQFRQLIPNEAVWG